MWAAAKRRSPSVLLAALMLGLLSASAPAQEADELIEDELVADGAEPRFGFLANGGFVYQSDADIDGGGKMQAFRYDIGAAGQSRLMDRLSWGNVFFFGVNDYDFEGGGPWNTILNARLGTNLTYDFTEQWGASIGGIFMFSPESGADWGDSFTGGGSLAAQYRHSKTLFVSLGVAVISQIEDDVAVTPQVAGIWLPAEDWALRVGGVPASGGAAASAEVAYSIIKPLEVGFGILYQQRRFRLDDGGPQSDGVGEDNSLPVRFRLGWNITENFGAHLLAGAALAGELKVEDSNGNRLASADYDPAAYVGLRILGGF